MTQDEGWGVDCHPYTVIRHKQYGEVVRYTRRPHFTP